MQTTQPKGLCHLRSFALSSVTYAAFSLTLQECPPSWWALLLLAVDCLVSVVAVFPVRYVDEVLLSIEYALIVWQFAYDFPETIDVRAVQIDSLSTTMLAIGCAADSDVSLFASVAAVHIQWTAELLSSRISYVVNESVNVLPDL